MTILSLSESKFPLTDHRYAVGPHDIAVKANAAPTGVEIVSRIFFA